jgi:hypothetical protein
MRGRRRGGGGGGGGPGVCPPLPFFVPNRLTIASGDWTTKHTHPGRHRRPSMPPPLALFLRRSTPLAEGKGGVVYPGGDRLLETMHHPPFPGILLLGTAQDLQIVCAQDLSVQYRRHLVPCCEADWPEDLAEAPSCAANRRPLLQAVLLQRYSSCTRTRTRQTSRTYMTKLIGYHQPRTATTQLPGKKKKGGNDDRRFLWGRALPLKRFEAGLNPVCWAARSQDDHFPFFPPAVRLDSSLDGQDSPALGCSS